MKRGLIGIELSGVFLVGAYSVPLLYLLYRVSNNRQTAGTAWWELVSEIPAVQSRTVNTDRQL